MNICNTCFLNERYGKSKNADFLYYALEKENDYYNSIKTELQNKENYK